MVVIVKLSIRIVSMVLSGICLMQMVQAAQTAGSATGALFPDVIANVNGQPIPGRDLEGIIRRELAAMGNPEWNDLREDYRGQLTYSGVTTLVNSKLIYDKAIASSVKATDAEVDEAMQSVAKNYASDAEMNAALAQQLLNRDSLRQKLEQELTITQYINSLATTVTVTPEEVSRYYAEHPEEFAHPDIVRVSHILLRGEEKPELDDQVKERAEALMARAKKGEDFAKLARENSVDNTASNGGDIGYVAKDALDANFAEAAFAMAVGDIRVSKSRFGYHVIKLTDKKKEGVSTLDEVREELTTLMKRDKAQSELNRLLNQLRDQAKIEVLIPYGQPLNP